MGIREESLAGEPGSCGSRLRPGVRGRGKGRDAPVAAGARG